MEVSMGRSSINGRCSWIFHSQVNCQRLVQHKLSYKAFFFTERKYTGGGQDSLPRTYSWNHQLIYSSSPYWIPHDTTHGWVTIPMIILVNLRMFLRSHSCWWSHRHHQDHHHLCNNSIHPISRNSRPWGGLKPMFLCISWQDLDGKNCSTRVSDPLSTC